MASRPLSPEQMLAAIPSLPRPMLVRLVDHMIDRLDELDGDPDDEDNGDPEPIDEREPAFWSIDSSSQVVYRGDAGRPW